MKCTVPEFDGDILLQLILESNSLYSTYSFNNSGFTMSYMSNSSNVNGSLSAYNLQK